MSNAVSWIEAIQKHPRMWVATNAQGIGLLDGILLMAGALYGPSPYTRHLEKTVPRAMPSLMEFHRAELDEAWFKGLCDKAIETLNPEVTSNEAK